MKDIGLTGLLIIIANVVVSNKAFKNYAFYESCTFRIDPILAGKDYKRLVTSGFVHTGWTHLIFNMISLYAFSGILENNVGAINFLLIYFGSLIGGGLLSLYIHRNHGNYGAVGASGAVSGIIFAAIALFPGMELGLIFIPISIPSWVFAILFVFISIRGIKSDRGNIGHDAHLGGGLVGMLIAVSLYPQALAENGIVIALVIVPTVTFIYLIIRKPEILILGASTKNARFESKDDQYNSQKVMLQEDVDKILDKISDKGFDSLTEKEKRTLKEYSRQNK